MSKKNQCFIKNRLPGGFLQLKFITKINTKILIERTNDLILLIYRISMK